MLLDNLDELQMKLTFLGATKTVTGSKYLLEWNEKKILIDCGMFQGLKELRLRNWEKLPIDPKTIDAVFLTHAHIDHSGWLPVLIQQGFHGPVYSTYATKDLCSILLPDSGHIHEEDARRANRYGYTKHRPALPLYTEEDGERAIKQFKAVDFGQNYSLFDDGDFSFHRAGHILGASIVQFNLDGKRLVFSGDLGRLNDPVMKPPVSIERADYLVVESTYGNRLHEQNDPLQRLGELIRKTVKRGGTVLIPSFAVGRAQLILYFLHQLKIKGELPEIPIFLDSPMAIDATDLFCKYNNEHQLSPTECRETCHTASYINTPEQSKMIDRHGVPRVIISASGMATGGRILHHIKAFGSDHRNTIIFAGYQAVGTRGDRLVKGEKKIKLLGAMIDINAEVEQLHNLSAHADSEEILTWLESIKKAPQKVFVTHGEAEAAEAMKEKISEKFGWSVEVPEYMDSFEL